MLPTLTGDHIAPSRAQQRPYGSLNMPTGPPAPTQPRARPAHKRAPGPNSYPVPALVHLFAEPSPGRTPILSALRGPFALSRHLSRLDKAKGPSRQLRDRGSTNPPKPKPGSPERENPPIHTLDQRSDTSPKTTHDQHFPTKHNQHSPTKNDQHPQKRGAPPPAGRPLHQPQIADIVCH